MAHASRWSTSDPRPSTTSVHHRTHDQHEKRADVVRERGDRHHRVALHQRLCEDLEWSPEHRRTTYNELHVQLMRKKREPIKLFRPSVPPPERAVMTAAPLVARTTPVIFRKLFFSRWKTIVRKTVINGWVVYAWHSAKLGLAKWMQRVQGKTTLRQGKGPDYQTCKCLLKSNEANLDVSPVHSLK